MTNASPQRRAGVWPLVVLLLSAMALAAALAALYLAPVVVARWRQVENQAAADAVYLKRQAELKAEADAAGKSLETLDGRVRLVAHGFRDVARKMAPVVVNITNE